jgi:hypothetical protein
VETMLEKPPKTIPKGHIPYENTLIKDTFAETFTLVEISPANSPFFLFFALKGIEIVEADTPAIRGKFNELAKTKKVAAIIHVTC